MMVLSKIFGGEPNNFETFVDKNSDLRMRDLIRQYSEVNNVPFKKPFHNKEGCEGWKSKYCTPERKLNFFKRFFGEIQNGEYEKFFEDNKDLKFKELVQKYSEQIGGVPCQTDMFVFRVNKDKKR